MHCPLATPANCEAGGAEARRNTGLRSAALPAPCLEQQCPCHERPMGRTAQSQQTSGYVGRARRRRLQPPAAGVPSVGAEPHSSRAVQGGGLLRCAAICVAGRRAGRSGQREVGLPRRGGQGQG